jgi:hypothetical protein
MKDQIVLSVAGLILLTVGCDKLGTKPAAKTKQEPLQEIGEKNIRGQWQAKSNPSLYQGGFFARADFLYWRADEEGLEYAARSSTQPGASKYSETSLSPEIEWSPGCRLGVGYVFANQDYWDLTLLWTHFQTTQKDSVSATAVPAWLRGGSGFMAQGGRARWHLSYNVYDASLGRDYFVSKTISVHPSVGLRGATIDQKYRAKYRAVSLGGTTTPFPTSMQAQNDFWGIGTRIGTQLQWRCSTSFALLGSVGGSLLYGDFKVKEHFKTVGSLGSASNVPIFMHEHLTTGAFNIEAFLGAQWERFFYQNTMKLAISLGYEWSQWLSQNRLFSYETEAGAQVAPVDCRRGNLTLQGATLQARWDF